MLLLVGRILKKSDVFLGAYYIGIDISMYVCMCVSVNLDKVLLYEPG